MKDPQSTFSERQRISSGPSDEKQKRQKVLPMQLKGQDTRKIVDWRSEWEKGNQNVVVGQSTLGSDELDKVSSQAQGVTKPHKHAYQITQGFALLRSHGIAMTTNILSTA